MKPWETPKGLEAMRSVPNRRGGLPELFRRSAVVALALLSGILVATPSAEAGKINWLDDVVREVIRETEAGGRAVVRGGDGASAAVRGSARLFGREADEGLEILAKRSEDFARAGRRVENTSEALLQTRFNRLLPQNVDSAKTFATLAPAEKRLVVELGETAQRLARRYPGEAESMVRALGTEGLSAVRVFGDDVAEVVVKEGNSSLGVLRKTGRGGWTFFTQTVLPHKKKLAAAGVLALFLADPDKFVDYAGRATEYAVREFSKAGIEIAGAVGGAAAKGLEDSIAQTLSKYGLNFAIFRYVGMALAGLVIALATLVVLGLPTRLALLPFTWPVRLLMGLRGASKPKAA